MICTVTLNPALDRTVTVSKLCPGEVNRALGSRTDPGGKGINVSMTLKKLGVDSCAMGFLAGETGKLVEKLAKERGLHTEFTFVPGETRTNTKLIDPESGETTDVNEPGPEITAEQLQEFTEKLLGKLHGGDDVVFSGSLPAGVPEDAYAKLIYRCRSKGVRTWLDTSGKALSEALSARPAIVKPNLEELTQCVGSQPEGLEQCANALRELGTLTGGNVELTMGEDGALLLWEGTVYYCCAPKILPVCTVGAGDSALAGLLAAENLGMETKDALVLSVAAGSAAAGSPGTGLDDLSSVIPLLDQLACTKLQKEGTDL